MTKELIYDHYFLVAGKIVFLQPDKDNPDMLPLNGYLRHHNNLISKKVLKAACTTLYHNFKERVLGNEPESKIQVLEVLLDNIIFLGQMEEDQFNDLGEEDPEEAEVTQ